MDEDEYETLNANVKLAAISRECFIRKVLNGTQLKVAPPIDYFHMIRELRRIGANVHQLLTLANAKGLLITSELRTTLEEIRHAQTALLEAVSVEDK